MKNRHVKTRLNDILEQLAGADDEAFVSDVTVQTICSMFSGLTSDAILRLEDDNELKVTDAWLLDIFGPANMDVEFNAAFERLCATHAGDFDQLYDFSCTFFYRAKEGENQNTKFVDTYCRILTPIVGEPTCERLLQKLRKFHVLR
ncbi:MAG: hypothetical protein AAFS08_05420 [Pseudomonadota bacterium]